LTNTH